LSPFPGSNSDDGERALLLPLLVAVLVRCALPAEVTRRCFEARLPPDEDKGRAARSFFWRLSGEENFIRNEPTLLSCVFMVFMWIVRFHCHLALRVD
jgi:hypothetical protein